MDERLYGPTEAWIGFKLKINPLELNLISCGGGGNCWVQYRYKEGLITMYHNMISALGRIFSCSGFESPDFETFHSGFCGKMPFPKDRKGKKLYSQGIKAEVWARMKN